MEHTYWTSVFKKILYLSILVIGIWIAFKLSIFYIPFVIAFVISLIMEPLIRYLMRKLKLSRKISSIIVFIIVFGSIIGLLVWGITTIISESTNLLSGINDYYDKAYNQIQDIMQRFNFEKLNVSSEILQFLQNTAFSILEKVSDYVERLVSGILKTLTGIPTFIIYLIITLLALYFICTDKIYMLDELEHHLPEKWMKEISTHLRGIIKTLGGYLKAQITLILISFIISLIGLYILYFLGMNIDYPLLIAIGIAFIDALPIVGSGTAMVPWAIISSLNGDLKLGISIVVLWIIMNITRQFLEPRIVSRKNWNSPYFYYHCYVYWV